MTDPANTLAFINKLAKTPNAPALANHAGNILNLANHYAAKAMRMESTLRQIGNGVTVEGNPVYCLDMAKGMARDALKEYGKIEFRWVNQPCEGGIVCDSEDAQHLKPAQLIT